MDFPLIKPRERVGMKCSMDTSIAQTKRATAFST
jgi:hypothetical protein